MAGRKSPQTARNTGGSEPAPVAVRPGFVPELILTKRQLGIYLKRLDRAIELLGLSDAEVREIQQTLLPEHYFDPSPPKPTTHPAGTTGKVSEMARRAKRGQAIFHVADPAPRLRPDPEYVLVVRLAAETREAAVAEARKRLRVAEGKSLPMPAGCSIEVV